MVFLRLFYWMFLYSVEYAWCSSKWLWTRESPGNYFAGLFLVTVAIILDDLAKSVIKELVGS